MVSGVLVCLIAAILLLRVETGRHSLESILPVPEPGRAAAGE